MKQGELGEQGSKGAGDGPGAANRIAKPQAKFEDVVDNSRGNFVPKVRVTPSAAAVLSPWVALLQRAGVLPFCA